MLATYQQIFNILQKIEANYKIISQDFFLKRTLINALTQFSVKKTSFLCIKKGKILGKGEYHLLNDIHQHFPMQELVKIIFHGISLEKTKELLRKNPAFSFCLEMAILNLQNGGNIFFPSLFTQGKDFIPINAILWLDKNSSLVERIKALIAEGYCSIKIKINGAEQHNILEITKTIEIIRNLYCPSQLEIRLDANGSFTSEKFFSFAKKCFNLGIHSIEQPLPPNNHCELKKICTLSPIPIALDEELFGIKDYEDKKNLLCKINPQFIVLKPSILGGFISCNEWIKVAISLNIGWWVTSALETSCGLNAIAQWVYTLNNSLFHGLSTVDIYKNDISLLSISQGKLWYKQ